MDDGIIQDVGLGMEYTSVLSWELRIRRTKTEKNEEFEGLKDSLNAAGSEIYEVFFIPVKYSLFNTQSANMWAGIGGYYYDIRIENTGTTDCLAATYELEPDSDLALVSGTLSGALGTIEPRKTKTITLRLSCAPIQNEHEFKKINVKINDTINHKTWDDSVSIKFNKASVKFNVLVESGKQVFGVIVVPNGKSYYFFRDSYVGGIVNPTIPWYSKSYLIVFLGASGYGGLYNTEAIYSLGINVAPYNYTDFTGFLDLGNYEPNDTEDTAYQLYMGDKIISYLHKNDIDYYRVNLGTP